MKILMLTTQLGYGGAETSFIRLANALAQRAEVTVALFTSDYGAGAYAKGHETLNASVILLDKDKACGRFARWARRIATMRKLKPQYDATISFLSGPNLVNALAGTNARTIVSLRGSRMYDPVAPKKQRWLFQYVLDPIIFHLAACIVPVSAGLANELWHGVRHKIHVVSPFVELSTVQQKLQEPVPAAYAALKGQPVVVAVGRLSVEKGFHHLIRVFSKLAQRQPGVKLLLVGDGPMMQQLRAQCEALGLAMDDVTAGVSAVLFAGYQKNVLPLMAQARVLALTSATEGFPSVLLEAMLARVPIVAADTPWGARAILGGNAQNAQAYPTAEATRALYGTLMPRIDQMEYEAQWVETLEAHLRAPHPLPVSVVQRAAQFDIALISEQWQRLIEGITMIDHPTHVPLLVKRIINRVGRPFGVNPFPRRFEYDLSAEQKVAAFDTIYEEERWVTGASRSGSGSELAATEKYREALAALLRERGFRSMFDAPCGDLTWMPSLLAEVPIRYEGGDIAAALVAQLTQRHPQLAIHQFDICRDAFPNADVWHCRDCLFHLPFADVRRALENFVASGIPYALLTTHHTFLLHKNLDLKGIGFRFLDLECAPISLPRALAYLPDYKLGRDFPRYVGLWSREMIVHALERSGR